MKKWNISNPISPNVFQFNLFGEMIFISKIWQFWTIITCSVIILEEFLCQKDLITQRHCFSSQHCTKLDNIWDLQELYKNTFIFLIFVSFLMKRKSCRTQLCLFLSVIYRRNCNTKFLNILLNSKMQDVRNFHFLT